MKIQYEPRVIDFSVRDASDGHTGGLTFGPHLHKHLEIVYMIEGRSKVSVDTEVCLVESGDLLVVFPNKVHSYADLDDDLKYILLHLDPYAVPEFAQQFLTMDSTSALIKGAADNSRLDSLIRLLVGYKDFPPEHRDILLRGYLLAFSAEFMSMMELSYTSSEENPTMKYIVAYCSQNFTKELSLAVLEKELHLSKYYISHLFGDILNIKFTDYVNSLRISEACRLLRTTDHSITEVSSMSGFGTLRTFNRAFIKRMGTSPSAYKKSRTEASSEIYNV